MRAISFRVGQAQVSADHRLTFGNGVDNAFPEIGEVVLHPRGT